MIRWKYVIPRLVILTVLFLAVLLGTNPLLRLAIVQLGQRAVGARVELDRAGVQWGPGSVQLNQLAVANPRSPMKNLIVAEATHLQLNTNALLRRELIVEEGRLTGLRIGTPRDSSGAINGSTKTVDESSKWGEKLEVLSDRWLADSTKVLQSDIEENLESIRLAKELYDRWPKKYEELEHRGKDVAARTQEWVKRFQQAPDNPLRAVETYREAATQLDQLRRDIVALHTDVLQVKEQATQDQRAIEQAKESDLKKIREHANLSQLDPATLSRYLFGPEVSPRIQEAIEWIQWVRKWIPASAEASPTVQRGEDILFPGLPVRPSLLVKRLLVDGQGSIGQSPVMFLGELTGLTHQPARHDEPAQLKLQALGALPMKVHAIFDRRHEGALDRVVVDCPKLALPARQLGKPERFALAVSEGTAHVWTKLELKQEHLQGEIILKQQNVELRPQWKADEKQAFWQQGIQRATDQIRNVEMLVTLDGTITQPRWEVKSNVGTLLSDSLNTLVAEEVAAAKTELTRRAHLALDEKLGEFRQQLFSQQESLLKDLQIGDQQIQKLIEDLGKRLGLSQRIFSKGLRIENLLRF